MPSECALDYDPTGNLAPVVLPSDPVELAFLNWKTCVGILKSQSPGSFLEAEELKDLPVLTEALHDAIDVSVAQWGEV